MNKLIFVVLIFASLCHSTTDTIVESFGYGESTKKATIDAISKAAEQSLGLLLSSYTIVQNYMLIRDVINTSSNAYVKKYETVSVKFDKNSKIYEVLIKAHVTKQLLMDKISAKMSKENVLDMSEIDKMKFEMTQAKSRSESAKIYYFAFIQNNFRKYIHFNVDSMVVLKKDVTTMSVSVRIDYSIWLSDDVGDFIKQSDELLARMSDFSDKIYAVMYNVILTSDRSGNEHILEKFETHNYKFEVANPSPNIKFINNSGWKDLPHELTSISSNKINNYQNSIFLDIPVDSIIPDLLLVKSNVTVVETDKQTDEDIEFNIVKNGLDINGDKIKPVKQLWVKRPGINQRIN